MNPELQLFFLRYNIFRIDGWLLMHLIGIAVVLIWAIIRRPKDFPFGWPTFIFMCLIFPVAGFVGARFGFALIHSTVSSDGKGFSSLFSTGGFAYIGTLAFSLVTLALLAKVRFKPVSFLKVADYVFPFILLEQAFGRIGCFLVGCCYGKPTDLPWGCVFRNVGHTPRHPTQIYYSIFLVVIFLTMRHLYSKKLPAGAIFFGSFVMYGFFRFWGEFLRVDSPHAIGPFTVAHLTMLCILTVSSIGLFLVLKRRTQ